MTRRASVMAVLLGASVLLGDGAMGGERREDLVAGLRAGGAEVKFLGRRGALEGWLVSPRGRSPYTLYVDETGHGVMGLLFAPEGRELTGRQVAAVREDTEEPGGIGKVEETRRESKGAGSEASRIEAEAERIRAETSRRRAEDERLREAHLSGKFASASSGLWCRLVEDRRRRPAGGPSRGGSGGGGVRPR